MGMECLKGGRSLANMCGLSHAYCTQRGRATSPRPRSLGRLGVRGTATALPYAESPTRRWGVAGMVCPRMYAYRAVFCSQDTAGRLVCRLLPAMDALWVFLFSPGVIISLR